MAEILGGIIFILVALVILGFHLFTYTAGKKTLSWPITQGTITQSTLLTTTSVDQGPSNRTSQSGTGVTIGGTVTTVSRVYSANIQYSYAVAGQQYQGSRVSTADTKSSSRQKYEQLVAQFPQGAAVNVYYDPQHPVDSVLQPGAKVSTGLVAFCVIFLGVGIYLLC